jgi:hypothetical protein
MHNQLMWGYSNRLKDGGLCCKTLWNEVYNKATKYNILSLVRSTALWDLLGSSIVNYMEKVFWYTKNYDIFGQTSTSTIPLYSCYVRNRRTPRWDLQNSSLKVLFKKYGFGCGFHDCKCFEVGLFYCSSYSLNAL